MKNVDWEDMAIGNSSLFIADIGNNYGNRTDLKIYKIPVSKVTNPKVEPDLIQLSYTAQTEFKRKNQNHSYDGEAIVYLNGELLLFSKDWVNFTTDVYRINEKLKNQKLERFQQFDVQGLITGAAFNNKDRIVLCGYNSSLEPFIAVISVTEGKLKLTDRIALPIVNGAQVEAITYFGNRGDQEVYYLTSEAVNIKLGEDEATSKGQLYKLTLKK
ncbi:gll0560 protein [Nonlabens marinus S1-08]|uniref:Gll0560 protein n=2 Tax=Nonlabens TaxID=363408 RepID=W8VZG2_9FLAO|nr:gll0560 protein [Nonlabens marinus S1-08]